MNEKQLNALSVFSLRELGRYIGVGSPTSKKKETIVNDIIAIQEGRLEPEKPKKRGRPPKNSIFKVEDLLALTQDDPCAKNLVLNQAKPLGEIPKNKEVIALAGIIEIINGIAYLWVQNNLQFTKYFVDIALVNQANAKAGDLVEVVAYHENKDLVVFSISTVNGLPVANNSHRLDFDAMPHVFPTETIPFANNSEFSNFNIMYGENIYLYGVNNNQNTIYATKFLNECSADVKMYLNFSLVEKNKVYLNSLTDSQLFVAHLTDDLLYAKDIVNLAYFRAKRLVEQGKKVVIAVDDILTMASIDDPELTLTRKFVSLTKCTEKGSVSLLTVMPADKCINLIEKLADKKLQVTKTGVSLLEVER